MGPISAGQVIRIWEEGHGQYPVFNAMSILSAACPEVSVEELEGLSIGRRNAGLLSVYEQMFGKSIECYAICPKCHKPAEFTTTTEDILSENETASAEDSCEMSLDGYRASFRLPDSRDLAAAIGCDSEREARNMLLWRCVTKVLRDEKPLSPEELPEDVIAGIVRRMETCDPLAATVLAVACPLCSHCWEIDFEITTFLWTRMAARAKRLLREVHVIATAYGWPEADILSMSGARRQFYLEMIG